MSPAPATQENWSSGRLPGLLSSLTKQGHVQGLLLTLAVAAWDGDRLGSDAPASGGSAGTPWSLLPVLRRSL